MLPALLHRKKWSVSDLAARLCEHGVQLSPSQVYRLVQKPPQRIDLKLLAALCLACNCGIVDILLFAPEPVAAPGFILPEKFRLPVTNR